MNRASPYPLVAPAAVLLAVFILIPLFLLIRVSLYEPPSGRGFYSPDTWTVQNYQSLVDSYHLRLIGFTLGFAAAVAVLAVIAGFPLAIFVQSRQGHWPVWAMMSLLIPKTAGTLAMLFGLQRLLPRGLLASICAEAYLIIPYIVLVLVIQLRGIDPTMAIAARGLGASQWQAFRRITVPLSWPGIVLAAELGMAWGLGAFAGPLFLGGPEEATLSVELHRQAFEYGRWPRAAAEAVVLLLLTLCAMALVRIRRQR